MKNVLKILLLSDTNSEHTEKWALGLALNGVKVGLYSFNKASYPWHQNNDNITVLFEPDNKVETDSFIDKISYLKYILPLKKVIKEFNPDIVHAHYATSYGLIGALSGFHPFVISAWGTDVMKFPQKNWVNKSILKFNLNKANVICATSHTIKNYLTPITNKKIQVVPFGVDTTKFIKKDTTSLFTNNDFVVGSIKSLEDLYNIDVLIKAFHILYTKYKHKSLKLLIIGVGSQEANLKQLVDDLDISKNVVFTGRIPFSEVSNYFNMLDVLVNISDYESFGVSVIEAMACEKAVVATDTGGLKEIIENDSYGSLVKVDDIEQTAAEIEKYLLNEHLKISVGQSARAKVIEKYNWTSNIKQMIDIYCGLVNNKK